MEENSSHKQKQLRIMEAHISLSEKGVTNKEKENTRLDLVVSGRIGSSSAQSWFLTYRNTSRYK